MSTHETHIDTYRINWIVYFVLLALLALAVAASIPNLHAWTVPVAMTIATIKALLILMYFMHVKFSPRLVWVYSTAAFLWLVIMIVLTWNDYYSRGWIEVLGK